MDADCFICCKAYAHLMRSIQKDKSDATIIYRLLIFVIFPVYPCFILAQNLAVALWRRYRRPRAGHHLRIYFWSSLTGLHVTTVDGSSEPFSSYEGWRAEVHPLDSSLLARLGRGLVLAVTSVQTIGMFVRLLYRFIYFERGYEAFSGMAVSDFEAYHLSIGLVAILAMSWSAWVMNVSWAEDSETLPGPKRLHSERFWRTNDRVLARAVRWVAFKGSLTGLLGLALFYALVVTVQ